MNAIAIKTHNISDKDKKRFFSKINKTDTCWIWTGAIGKSGYGMFSIKYKAYTAHRMSVLIHVGFINPGLHVDHLCRNRSCVNPNHLEAVTIAENVMRGVGVAPLNKSKTHCPKGHEYSIENTLIRKSGRRRCKKCAYKAQKEWYENQKSLLLFRIG